MQNKLKQTPNWIPNITFQTYFTTVYNTLISSHFIYTNNAQAIHILQLLDYTYNVYHTCIKLSSFIKVLGNSKKASRDNKKNN